MKQSVDTEELLARIVEGIQEKKGKRIVTLDLRKLDNAICSYYVICNADSGTQVEAIANSVDEVVREKCGEKPWRTDGFT
ncbi:MAG TPA: RsfS/YbeB/iojap family protein, partial [Williamwhitmania sp.]|nr:RsfS/YbeB/iojap family protein [Williamwhitmania sp.]